MEDICDKIWQQLRPYGWFSSVGIAQDHLVIYLAKRLSRQDRKIIDDIIKNHQGHKIKLEYMGKIIPL